MTKLPTCSTPKFLFVFVAHVRNSYLAWKKSGTRRASTHRTVISRNSKRQFRTKSEVGSNDKVLSTAVDSYNWYWKASIMSVENKQQSSLFSTKLLETQESAETFGLARSMVQPAAVTHTREYTHAHTHIYVPTYESLLLASSYTTTDLAGLERDPFSLSLMAHLSQPDPRRRGLESTSKKQFGLWSNLVKIHLQMQLSRVKSKSIRARRGACIHC